MTTDDEQWQKQLEIVAINEVLPLKAARRDAIVNLKCFGASEHQRPNFDGFIYIHYAAPPYSAGISAIYLLLIGYVWVPYAELRVQRLAMKQCRIYGG